MKGAQTVTHTQLSSNSWSRYAKFPGLSEISTRP
jgi:hypothetical protein